MHNLFRIVFLFLALAANAALAQQSIVYTVEGWPAAKSPANAFVWGVTFPVTVAQAASGAGQGKVNIQDVSLTMPLGDNAVMFAHTALNGGHLRSVLIEFPLRNANPSAPAPFAMRLSEVIVTSVTLGKSGDGGAGTAEVKLNAARVELFTTTQDKTGRPIPGAKAGFDTATKRGF